MGIGGRSVFGDACDVPNTQIIFYDFATAPVLYEVHIFLQGKGSSKMHGFRGEAVGVIVDCEGGSVSLYRGVPGTGTGSKCERFPAAATTRKNCIRAVRSGRREDLQRGVSRWVTLHPSATWEHLPSSRPCRPGEGAAVGGRRRSPSWPRCTDRFVAHLEAHEVDPGLATL